MSEIIWNLPFSFWPTQLSTAPSRSILVVSNRKISFLWLSSIPLYIPHLSYSLLHQWTFRLFPFLGYYKQFCNEHRSAHICSNWCSCILQINTQHWNSTVIWHFYSLICLGICMLFSIVAAPFYVLTNSVPGFPFLHILSNTCFLSFS